jgi:hypothetical protein
VLCSGDPTGEKIGFEPGSHIGGGFSEWKYSGAAIEEVEKL